jgi:hypothetical protein
MIYSFLNAYSVGAVYIGTDGVFPVRRFYQMMLAFHKKFPVLKNADMGKNVHCAFASDLETQDRMIFYQLPVLLSRHDVRLVIIDSISANLRGELTDRRDLGERAREICRTGIRLKQISDLHDVAIVCVNQVHDYFLEDALVRKVWEYDYQQRQFVDQGCKSPALGLVWTNTINARIMLSRPRRQCYGSVRRTIAVAKSPLAPRSSGEFIVDNDGVFGLRGDDRSNSR